MFEDVVNKVYEYLDENVDLELVEIIEASEHGTPRKEGAFMFVDKNGESFGTVGGGKVEYMATQYAKDLLMNKSDGRKKYNMSQEQTDNLGLICGGDAEFQFTYITNDEKSRTIIDRLKESVKNKNTVYIFGAGHVSMELSKVLHYVGFDTVIWDDREEFANVDRFPNSKRVISRPFDNILSEVNITDKDFAVIMTRGHSYDYLVEKLVLNTKAAYIGVIGSSNKCKVLREKLIEDGFSEEKLDKVCAPIGFKIAAETPEEIAVAIASEIILYRSCLEKRRKVMNDNELVKMYRDKRAIS